MKRKDLVRQLTAQGCELLRHGSRHDIYINTKNGMKQPVRVMARSTKDSLDILRSIWDLKINNLGAETR